MIHTPLSRYQQDLERPDFEEDDAQRLAVEQLQNLYQQLVNAPPRKQGLLSRMGWRKRQAREAHLADELALSDSPEVGRDTAAGSTTLTDNDDATTGQETGPAEGRVAHIFRRRFQPELRNAVAEPASDESGTTT